jgi:hypothetical protein
MVNGDAEGDGGDGGVCVSVVVNGDEEIFDFRFLLLCQPINTLGICRRKNSSSVNHNNGSG